MAVDFEIRATTMEDVPGVARVRVLTWKDAYRDILEPEFLATQTVEGAIPSMVERMALEETMPEPKPYRLVATRGDEILGFCAAGQSPLEQFAGEWFMFALYVLPEAQGMGIGKALMNAVQDEGRRRGAKRMLFGVFSNNEPSKAFYFRQGARPVLKQDFELAGRLYPTDYCEVIL